MEDSTYTTSSLTEVLTKMLEKKREDQNKYLEELTSKIDGVVISKAALEIMVALIGRHEFDISQAVTTAWSMAEHLNQLEEKYVASRTQKPN